MRSATLFMMAMIALGSEPARLVSPDDLLRRGNAAYRCTDYAEAEELYKQSLERTSDPGLVAFNLGSTEARRGDPRASEEWYRRVLDDKSTPPTRRAAAYYNRGVCLLQRGEKAVVYRQAIVCFEKAMTEAPKEKVLLEDAKHNLELAKLLWNLARLKEKERPRPSDVPPPLNPPESRQPDRKEDQSEPSEDENQNPSSGKSQQAAPKPTKSLTTQKTTEQSPGSGPKPVQNPRVPPKPQTKEERDEELQKIAKRLQEIRAREDNILGGPPRSKLRDW